MSETLTVEVCAVCDQPQRFRWTDTHGVGACLTCGAPYRIYHYEENKRVEGAPSLEMVDWFVPFARQYWQENRRNVFPGAYNFPGSSYEVASNEDFETFRDWMVSHHSEIEAASPPEPA